jgi:colanic acid/amylovoran biosynthesis protein
MRPLTLEIHGTGTHNRGAELMAIAIAERMRSTFANTRIAVPRHFGSAEDRRRYGLLATADLLGGLRSRAAGVVMRLSGPRLRARMGFVDPSEIDVVLDASGFAFSDQWGARAAASLVRKMRRPERLHQQLILLPQALGPFSDPVVAKACRTLFDRADLICARDEQSFAAALPLVGIHKLRLYPDFTLGVKAVSPASPVLPPSFSGIVPNCRMLDKTRDGEKYLAFLETAIDLLSQAGMNPLFILHDAAEDRRVIDQVRGKVPLKILEHHDPRVLKWILGRADLVIGSRFHALVGALSQGVPCIGAGWSHKYHELFHDFGVPELLIEDLKDTRRLSDVFATLDSPEKRAPVRETIAAAGDLLKNKTESMWQDVETMVRERAGVDAGNDRHAR